MLDFLVLDFDKYNIELLGESEFIDKYDVDRLDPKDFDSEADRIEELVEGNGYEIAWDRMEALNKIIDEMESLDLEEGSGDGETLVYYAKMLTTLGQSNWWDTILNNNSPFSPDIAFDL